jgi:sodium-coupled neutral amino acid transporter 11
MCIIVTTVVLRGVAVEPELRGPPLHAVSLIRSGVFEAIGVISFAVSSLIICRDRKIETH